MILLSLPYWLDAKCEKNKAVEDAYFNRRPFSGAFNITT
jgi:hypothetical protein